MGLFPVTAQKFILSLLKTTNERVGCSGDGLAEVFDSKYFYGLNFGDLDEGKIKPPFVPGPLFLSQRRVSRMNTKRRKRGKGDRATFSRNIDTFDVGKINLDDENESAANRELSTEVIMKRLSRRMSSRRRSSGGSLIRRISRLSLSSKGSQGSFTFGGSASFRGSKKQTKSDKGKIHFLVRFIFYSHFSFSDFCFYFFRICF